MSTALVLGAQLDPPPGPISSANTLRSQHTMPAPTASAASSSQSHWSQPASTAAQHHSASVYSTYSSPASHSGMYASTSPHQSHQMSSYHSPGQQPQSHMSYTGYNNHHHHTSAAQQNASDPPTPVANNRASLNGGHSPADSPQVPVTSVASLPPTTHSSAATGGLNIAGMLNQPVATAASTGSSHSYSSRYGGSNQPTPVSHPDHQNGYFVSAPIGGEMNGHLVSPPIPSSSGAGSSGSMPAYSNTSYVHPNSHSHQHSSSHSGGGLPVSAGSYHSHGGYMPLMTSSHPGLHTPGLSTGVSGMGISPSTGLGVQVYSHLPMGNRHRVTTTLWEDEGTLCFQVDAKGVCVARRSDNNMINGTKLLNVCGMTRGKRDGILKNEKERIVVKVGAMHLKGVWISFERAKALAESNEIIDILYPLFEHNLQDFLYQPEYPRSSFMMQGSHERLAQRPRVLGPMSGVPASSTSMSPPLSVPATMSQHASGGITTTLSMPPYSAPISSTYPNISNVTHPPLMRSQTTPSFAMPLPRQSPIVTSSPNGTWGHQQQHHFSQQAYYPSQQSPSVGQVSSFHYQSQYGHSNPQSGNSSGSMGHAGRDDDSQGSANGSLARPAGVDRRHTDPLGVPGIGDSTDSNTSYYSSRLPPAAVSSSSSLPAGGRAQSGSVSSMSGAPHSRRTSGLKRSHDATD
ncbi:hypothetical protein CF327_g3775 [Tilletia walkeri]|nr:hypothetical protein CF327_g3775 [Tilletia walkeri]